MILYFLSYNNNNSEKNRPHRHFSDPSLPISWWICSLSKLDDCTSYPGFLPCHRCPGFWRLLSVFNLYCYQITRQVVKPDNSAKADIKAFNHRRGPYSWVHWLYEIVQIEWCLLHPKHWSLLCHLPEKINSLSILFFLLLFFQRLGDAISSHWFLRESQAS